MGALIALSTLVPASAGDPECGFHCLYVALRSLDVPVEREELKKRLGPTLAEGYSLGRLEEIARQYGVETLGVETSVENLRRRPGRFACIAHVDENHFVLLTAAPEGGPVHVIDPPGSYDQPPETLAFRWDGTALLLSPDPLLAEEDLPRPFPWVLTLGGAVAVICGIGLVFVVRRKRD